MLKCIHLQINMQMCLSNTVQFCIHYWPTKPSVSLFSSSSTGVFLFLVAALKSSSCPGAAEESVSWPGDSKWKQTLLSAAPCCATSNQNRLRRFDRRLPLRSRCSVGYEFRGWHVFCVCHKLPCRRSQNSASLCKFGKNVWRLLSVSLLLTLCCVISGCHWANCRALSPTWCSLPLLRLM